MNKEKRSIEKESQEGFKTIRILIQQKPEGINQEKRNIKAKKSNTRKEII